MKYLFFDIECSNCFDGIGKICEFGYVITDENFKIVHQQEIAMSPGRGKDCRFHLKDRKKQRGIEFAYEYDYYFEQPEFNYFYESIRKLIEDTETICFAWSSNNDMLHLFHTCQRYGKEPMRYICYDVQKIAANYLGIKQQICLKTACQTIVGKESTICLQEHLSSDDAKMTMMIFKTITVRNKMDLKAFLEKYEFAKDDAYNYIINFENKVRKLRENKKRHQLYKKIVKKDSILLKTTEFKGKKYNLSEELKIKVEDLQDVINKVHSLGSIIVDNLDEVDYFVVYDENNKKHITNKFNGVHNVHLMLLEELMTK